jgi:hypothetical protein
MFRLWGLPRPAEVFELSALRKSSAPVKNSSGIHEGRVAWLFAIEPAPSVSCAPLELSFSRLRLGLLFWMAVRNQRHGQIRGSFL